jgi:MFS family permease
MCTYFSAALLSVPSGMIVDRIGMRRYISIFGSVLFLGVQLILYFATEQTPSFFIFFAFSMLGFGLSIYANCVLSSASMIVKTKILGTAFGIIQMLESVALCFFPLISGALVDEG